MLGNSHAKTSGKIPPGLLGVLLLLCLAVWFFVQNDSKPPSAAETPERAAPQPSAVQARPTPPPPHHHETRPARPPEAEHEHRVALRSRTGPLEPSVAEIASQFSENEVPPIEIPTFDDASVHISIRNANRIDDGRVSIITGSVVNEPGSLVSIAQSGSSTSGSILIPSQNLVYEIRPNPGGGMIFSEIDVHALGECQLCIDATASH